MTTAHALIAPVISVDPEICNLHRWANSREVADFVGCSVDALRLQRYRGTGPRFTRHGRVVRYWLLDVHSYLCQGLRGGES